MWFGTHLWLCNISSSCIDWTMPRTSVGRMRRQTTNLWRHSFPNNEDCLSHSLFRLLSPVPLLYPWSAWNYPYSVCLTCIMWLISILVESRMGLSDSFFHWQGSVYRWECSLITVRKQQEKYCAGKVKYVNLETSGKEQVMKLSFKLAIHDFHHCQI